MRDISKIPVSGEDNLNIHSLDLGEEKYDIMAMIYTSILFNFTILYASVNFKRFKLNIYTLSAQLENVVKI